MDNIIEVHPIIGEITSDGVVFLIVTLVSIVIDLYFNNEYYQSYVTNSHEPTRIFVTISKPGNYTWKYKNIVISNHDIKSDYNKMVFLSCDLPAADTKHSLWKKLAKREKNGICFHLGDNIYGDRAYGSDDHDYNDIYIKTWSRWSPIMNNFTHMMVADDHEICDGYDYNFPSNPVIEKGLLAYKQYQTNLLQQNQYPSFFVKDVGYNTTVYGLSRTMMGINPLSLIKQIKDSLRGNIILAISSAPVPQPSGIEGNLYGLIFGSFGWENDDLTELYDICFELLESGQVDNIILIGGDLHIGISGVIKKTGSTKSIPVYVSSGITVYPSSIEHLLACAMTCKLEFNNYTLDLESKAYRNYLTIPLPLSTTNPGTLTYSEESIPNNLLDYFRELSYIVKARVSQL